VLSVAPSEAQTVGFKLGASMSNMIYGSPPGDSDYTTGFMGGGFIRFGLGRLGIQPEVLSVTKGTRLDGVTNETTINIQYIAVPVLLHLPLAPGASFAPYLIAGPEFAFDIGCEFSGGGQDIDCDDDTIPGLAWERKSVDIGLSAGGGLTFAMGPGALLLEGRYTWGISDIAETETEDAEFKNRSAYILAGYSIPLGRGQ
jgi:hypothetical protein